MIHVNIDFVGLASPGGKLYFYRVCDGASAGNGWAD